MARFRGYRNRYSKKNRIYSMEELLKMSMGDFFDNENEIDSQDSIIGLPTNSELQNSPNVRYIEGFVNDSGENVPAKWESILPSQEEVMITLEGLKNPEKGVGLNPMTDEYPELSEVTQKEIDKLNQSKQEDVQMPKFEDLRKDINLPEGDLSELEPADKTAETSKNNLSQLLDSASMILSMLQQNGMMNNIDLGNNIPETDKNMYMVNSNQPDTRMYLVDPNTQNVKMYANNQKSDEEKIGDKNEIKDSPQEQPQLNENLAEYINDLLGSQLDKDIQNLKITFPKEQTDENITLYGGITNTPDVVESEPTKATPSVYLDKDGKAHRIDENGNEVKNDLNIWDNIFDNKSSNEPIRYQDAQGNWHDSNIKDNAVIDETWKYVAGAYPTTRAAKLALEYAPYINDIWEGKDLLWHKPFEKMTKEEIVNFTKKGKNFYKKILNPQTTENKEIGIIHFPNARAMESDYKYMEQYPFVRKNIKNAKENIFLKPKTKQNKKQHLDAEGFNNLKVKWKGKEYDYQIRKNSNDGNNDFYNIKPYEYLEKDIQELLLKILLGN